MIIEEAVDKVLEYDIRHNPERTGFIEPFSLFDRLDIPKEYHKRVIGCMEHNSLIEYNNAKNIRASYIGVEIFNKGGFAKKVKEEKRIEDAKNRKTIFDYNQRWFTHPLVTIPFGAILGYLIGVLTGC